MMTDKLAFHHPLKVISISTLSLCVLIGFLVRILFFFFLPEGASLTVLEGVKLLAVGVINDIAMGAVLLTPLLLISLGLNEVKYKKPVAIIIMLGLLYAVFRVFFTHSIFHDYGGGTSRIAQIFFSYKLLSFSIRYFVPRVRQTWRRVTLILLWVLYVFVLLFNAVGEYFFWDEFGVRYNFIAVDYLLYTHEVIGNIMESYAIIPLIAIVAVLTVAFVYWYYRKWAWRLNNICAGWKYLLHFVGAALVAVVSLLYLNYGSARLEGDNLCANQLQQNGTYDFFTAFRSNELDYSAFYQLLPEVESKERYYSLCGMDSTGKVTMVDPVPMEKRNVVLITVESLSSSFLKSYGCDKDLTPNLDSLITRSLAFDNMYALGNRTVRGLEALSLCVPPSAGESIIKRKNNRADGRSVGDLFGREGYKVRFFYGGDSYFDNMRDFFSHNGYEVTDRKQLSNDEITFANIWGVCDEDMYKKMLSVLDEDAQSGAPFFAQLMTVSNHRPYTYPDGKITYEGKAQSREAAVKYTDYAIGQFMRMAKTKPWFSNTLFIIIADHQASSAGKTSIPVHRYHIPCIVYAPQLVAPQRVSTLCSQIDLIPTVLSMLHYSGTTTFAGQDILSPDFKSRAMMATYQDLGYLQDNVLTVLSPVRKVQQYAVNYDGIDYVTDKLMNTVNKDVLLNAQAYYQWANLYYMPGNQ